MRVLGLSARLSAAWSVAQATLALLSMAVLGVAASALPGGPIFPGPVFPTGAGPISLAIGDLDGDGRPDLAVANQNSNTVSVLRNFGNALFAAVDYATGVSPRSVAIGDLDGDGRPDLVTANLSSSTVSVLRNLGNGAFAARADYATGNGPYSVAIGDLDGDGRPDVVAANASNTVSVLRNLGNGVLAPKVDYTTGSGPWSVAIGDLDGDGRPELVMANYANGYGNTVSVLRNLGNGAYAPRVDYATGIAPSCVWIDDVDGDGRPDLAVANSGNGTGNTVSVLRNLGNGAFAARADYATGSGPFSVAIGDLDGDGRPDLAVANQSSSTVSVLRNLSCPGDANGDNRVDFFDLNFVLADYGLTGPDLPGDINGDGIVDFFDLNTLLANYGRAC